MKCQKVGHWTHNLQIGPNNLFYFTNLANNFLRRLAPVKMALTKVFSKTVLVQTVSRKTVLSGSSNGSPATSRALSSVLAESYYNQEQKELQATAKKLIETEINPVSNLT